MNSKHSGPKRPILTLILVLAASCHSVLQAKWGNLPSMHNYNEVFDLGRTKSAFKATMLESNAPGNVFHPGEEPRFTFQIENFTDEPIKTTGNVEIIRYAQRGWPGDNWHPELVRLEQLPAAPLSVALKPRGWANITIEPATPETKGGYALVVDLGRSGRQYLTSYVRTFKPDLKRIQFPAQSLEEMPAPILARLGVQAIRWAIAYDPTDSARYAEQRAKIKHELAEFHKY